MGSRELELQRAQLVTGARPPVFGNTFSLDSDFVVVVCSLRRELYICKQKLAIATIIIYSMIQQKWNKVNFNNSALKPLPWHPNALGQNDRNFGTF